MSTDPMLSVALTVGTLTLFVAGYQNIQRGDSFLGMTFVAIATFWLGFVLFDTTRSPFASGATRADELAFCGVWTLVNMTLLLGSRKEGPSVLAVLGLWVFAFGLLEALWILYLAPAAAPTIYALGYRIGGVLFADGLAAWLSATRLVAGSASAGRGRREVECPDGEMSDHSGLRNERDASEAAGSVGSVKRLETRKAGCPSRALAFPDRCGRSASPVRPNRFRGSRRFCGWAAPRT
jgi:succinate-acetate transporter protein